MSAVLFMLALIGAVAALRAHHIAKVRLARLRREAERVHAYHEAMRRVRA